MDQSKSETSADNADRAAHFKAVRDKLIEQKNEARAKTLKEHNDKKAEEKRPPVPAPLVRQQTADDMKRAELRHALLSKLKDEISS
mmetsp:Transcript_4521/g.9348  ORF Transcript_4521/g.9348 Transcript_4521/m.9348 type:complete len:86 (+) Transcript_4521:528-785(+)